MLGDGEQEALATNRLCLWHVLINYCVLLFSQSATLETMDVLLDGIRDFVIQPLRVYEAQIKLLQAKK